MFNISMDDMRSFIEQRLNDAIQQKGNELADALESKLGSVGSEYYDRTGQVINALRNPPAVKVTKQGKIIWQFVDYNKILNKRSGDISKLNHHMSIDGSKTFDGQNIKYLVHMWLDEGFTLLSGNRFEGLDYISQVFPNSSSVDNFIQEIAENAAEEFTIAMIKSFNGGR